MLVRQFVEEVYAEWGSTDYIDRWLTPNFQFHLNGTDMDLAAYRQGMSATYGSFASMPHEILFMIAENDLVTTVMTIHPTHTGEWEGIPPTGRTVSAAHCVIFRLRDGKLAEEWVVTDKAGLRQQLEARE